MKGIIQPQIIQFSPIRSGSTLVYNILRELLPTYDIIKRHSINETIIQGNRLVVTYRHPLDCLASSFKRYNLQVNKGNIEDQIDELKTNGLDDLLKIWSNDHVLKLRYEDYYNNLEIVFDEFELFFHKPISRNFRDKMMNKYNIEQVLDNTKQYNSFSEYDKTTQFHGNHISSSKGAPNAYTHFFKPEEITYLDDVLGPYINELGYSVIRS